MKEFERKMIERAYDLRQSIKKTEYALQNSGVYGIKGVEGTLIETDLHAMSISYNSLVQRIELRNLTKEYAEYVAKQVKQNQDTPF